MTSALQMTNALQPKTADIPAPATGFDRFIELALDKQVPVETLERLLAMQKEIMAANAKAAYDEALSAFQKECPIIHKGTEVRNSPAKGGGIRYRYAAMDSIISQVREPLSKHGFSYSADTEIDDKGWIVTKVTSYHVAGHSRTTTFKVPVDKDAFMNEQQKVAAARTYALRYNFVGHFGIMTGDEDDDTTSIEPSKPGTAEHTTKPKPEKPKPAPTTTNTTTTANQQQAIGIITNMEALPCKKLKPTDADKFRYKITIEGYEKPFYTFDKKINDLCKDEAANGPATIVFENGKWGQDIKSLIFSHIAPLEKYDGELEGKK